MSSVFTYKILAIGDGDTGKTSLITRYTEKKFTGEYIPTIGCSWLKKLVEFLGVPGNLVLWDIAGQPTFKEVRNSFYIGAHGAIFVFDVTRPDTLKNIDSWNSELGKEVKDIPKILVGNKTDLEDERKVLTKHGKEMVRKLGFDGYIETSAKNSDNVVKMFVLMLEKIARKTGLLEMAEKLRKNQDKINKTIDDLITLLDSDISVIDFVNNVRTVSEIISQIDTEHPSIGSLGRIPMKYLMSHSEHHILDESERSIIKDSLKELKTPTIIQS